MFYKIMQGDVLAKLKELPSESVDCVVTSPPYWALRDYGIEPIIWDENGNCQHEWNKSQKAGNLRFRKGHNAIVGNHTKEEIWRDISDADVCILCGVWKGQLGLEPNFDLYIKHLLQIFDEVKRVLKKTGTCFVNLGDTYGGSGDKGSYKDPKNPEGRNGQVKALNRKATPKSLCLIPQRFAIGMVERGWICRNDLIWWKRNCMPSSARDRFTVDFEHIFFFTKNPKYYFEQLKRPLAESTMNDRRKGKRIVYDKGKGSTFVSIKNSEANERCVWNITTKGFPEAHFAVFPEELPLRCIKAGCPPEGIVLDLFLGSGTTMKVARDLKRNCIGIELNPKYVEIAKRRVNWNNGIDGHTYED